MKMKEDYKPYFFDKIDQLKKAFESNELTRESFDEALTQISAEVDRALSDAKISAVAFVQILDKMDTCR